MNWAMDGRSMVDGEAGEAVISELWAEDNTSEKVEPVTAGGLVAPLVAPYDDPLVALLMSIFFPSRFLGEEFAILNPTRSLAASGRAAGRMPPFPCHCRAISIPLRGDKHTREEASCTIHPCCGWNIL
jgi:hypothetical protein